MFKKVIEIFTQKPAEYDIVNLEEIEVKPKESTVDLDGFFIRNEK
ncbi:hypothetical protein [Paraliobacillus zengyii]|nr:hypothetical protein [Paraliobacillus zengyii]